MADGYLPEAVSNYIALLGWCPKDNQEMFTLEGLVESFSIDGISKSPAVFDYDKLTWFNGEYIRGKSPEEFLQLAKPYFRQAFPDTEAPYPKLVEILQPRVTRLTQIPEMIGFFQKLPGYEKELFINKKSKTNLENSKEVLENTIALLEALPNWNHDGIHDCLIQYAQEKGLKNGTVMWPVRIAAAGQLVTPGGAIEILEILGREESLRRLRLALPNYKKGACFMPEIVKPAEGEETPSNFIQDYIVEDLKAGGQFEGKQVHTRFPPEPNGYLHIGHAKAVCIDFGTAEKFGGICNLRMDDTNPTKEDVEYVDAIKEDIHWLGFDWDNRFYYASEYFEKCEFACRLIKKRV